MREEKSILLLHYPKRKTECVFLFQIKGPGLKDIDVSKLFTRFYQGENSRPGSGIGLSYTKFWQNSKAAVSAHSIMLNLQVLLLV